MFDGKGLIVIVFMYKCNSNKISSLYIVYLSYDIVGDV